MIQLGYDIQLSYTIGFDQQDYCEFFEREFAPALASAFGESDRGR